MYINGHCSCGYNEYGNAYCTPFMQDIQGQEFREYWTEFVSDGGLTKCNTERRYNPECWILSKGEEFYTRFDAAYKTFVWLAQLYQNDDCVTNMITNQLFPTN